MRGGEVVAGTVSCSVGSTQTVRLRWRREESVMLTRSGLPAHARRHKNWGRDSPDQTRPCQAHLYRALWDILCDSLFVVLDSMYNFIYHLTASWFVDTTWISFSLLLQCQTELNQPAKTLILPSFQLITFLIKVHLEVDGIQLQILSNSCYIKDLGKIANNNNNDKNQYRPFHE